MSDLTATENDLLREEIARLRDEIDSMRKYLKSRSMGPPSMVNHWENYLAIQRKSDAD